MKQNIYRGWRLYFNDLKVAESELSRPNASEVDYLGHKIDAIGIHPLADRDELIRNAKVPENVTESRQLLGLINYHGKFLNQLSTTLAPLHSLLRADAEWKWTTDGDAAVKTVKEHLTGAHPL